MEPESPLEAECAVSGVLAFIVRVSRVAGTAPVRLRRGHGATRARLSRGYHLYGHLVVLLLLTMISCFTFQNRKDVVDGYDSATNTWFISVMKATLTAMRLVVGNVVVHQSYDRMRHFINCTAKVDQINQEFDRFFEPTLKSERISWFIVIAAMIHAYVAVSMEYGGFMNDMVAANTRIPISSCLFCGTFLYMLHLQTYPLLFYVVVLRLAGAQERLNTCLRKLLQEIRHTSTSPSRSFAPSIAYPKYIVFKNEMRIDMAKPIGIDSITKVIDLLPVLDTEGAQTAPRLIERLAQVHCALCDAVRQLNHSHGLSLVMFLIYIGLYTVTAPYFVVAMLFRNQSEAPAFRVMCIFAWCSLCFAMLAMVTEPCHRTHYQPVLVTCSQLFQTERLVNQLLRFTRREYSTLSYELKMFRRHIQLNPVSFSPMYFLTFDRTLLVALFTTIITYLTVMINL